MSEFFEPYWAPQRQPWREWAEGKVQTGDLLFTRSPYRIMLGLIDLADVTCLVCESQLSHVGVIVIEDGAPYVYDISDPGVQRTEFARYLTRAGYQTVAIRRPDESLYPLLPRVVAQLRWHFSQQTKFDTHYRLDNSELYCSEYVVDAFAAAGVQLCEPVPIGELPGIAALPPWIRKLATTKTGLTDRTPVYAIGNERLGLYGAPRLQTILEPTAIDQPPTNGAR